MKTYERLFYIYELLKAYYEYNLYGNNLQVIYDFK